MKRFLSLLLILVLSVLPALADPLPMLEDYAEDLVVPYDESDPSAGVFSYSYRYPHVDENAEGGMGINVFFSELLDYENEFIVPMIQDAYVGSDTSTMISYTVTCNNDDYFSRVNPYRKKHSGSFTGYVERACLFQEKRYKRIHLFTAHAARNPFPD